MVRALLLTALNTLLLSFALSQYVHSAGFKVEFEVQNEGEEVTGQLFWRSIHGQFQEYDSTLALIPAARTSVAAYRIPSDVAVVRFDPAYERSTLLLKRVTLKTVMPFNSYDWSSSNRFAGIQLQEVPSSELTADGMRLQTVFDPAMIIDIRPARSALRRQLIWLEGLLLLGFAAVHLRLSRGVLRPAALSEPAKTEPASAEPARPARRFKLLTAYNLYVLALVAAAAVAGRLYLSWKAEKRAQAVNAARVSLVDRYGNALVDARSNAVEKDLGLRVTLDPFMLTRYFPNQSWPGYRINEFSLRETLDPADPRRKLVLLGGSAAFSLGVSDEQKTMSAHLRRLNPSFQVINAGVVGALSGQELSHMVHYLDAHKPSVYVTFSGWNDFYTQIKPRTKNHLGFNQHFLDEVEAAVRMSCSTCQAPPADDGAPFTEPNDTERLARGYVENLGKMRAFAGARGAKFFAVIQPDLGNKKHPTPAEKHSVDGFAGYNPLGDRFGGLYRSFVLEIVKRAEQEGIRIYDMNADPEFQERTDELFLDECHLSQGGTELAAKLVTQKLQLSEL